MASQSPIFVVGMNGSGTTMLADSLGRHPALYMFPRESKVLPFFIGELGRFGDLSSAASRRRLADKIGRTKPYWHANNKRALTLDDAELRGCSTFGDVISCIYAHLAAREGKSRWGERSPTNVQHISTLARHFSDARFIHIIRDGRDAAQSFHRRWGFDPRHTIWRWKRTVTDGRAQGTTLGGSRYLEVRYELLTTEPEREMRRVCRFADLSFHSAMLGSSMRYMDPRCRPTDSGRIVENSEKWRTYFDPRQIAALEAIAGRALVQLGYSVEHAGDRDLGSWERRLLMARDGIARTIFFFRQRGIRALPRYAKSVAASRKQWSASRY